jgi:hypothetical protein
MSLLLRRLVLAVALCVAGAATARAQVVRHPPTVTLVPAQTQQLVRAGDPVVDSNSPVIWDLVDGVPTLFVMTSFDGVANVSSGRGVGAVTIGESANWDRWPLGGAWMEAVVKADDGTWYGYYHNEVAPAACPGGTGKVQPQIGAARSMDQGRTWTNLGIILAAPTAVDCDTRNQYFTGGVGDFSVMLSPDRTQLFLLYSQYAPATAGQGVAMARMAVTIPPASSMSGMAVAGARCGPYGVPTARWRAGTGPWASRSFRRPIRGTMATPPMRSGVPRCTGMRTCSTM